MDPLPRLGPRVWWVYLAVDTPKTVAQLAEEAGIVEESIRRHLRRLEREGLVRETREPGAPTMWVQARGLDPATRYRVVGRVQRGRLQEPPDLLAPEHGRRARRWWWPFRR
ncbi:helix-turn-helix protein [Nocardioides sp. J9]|uniref:ArsR family transcriptional regulator n=1 Tax=Nocardioides sp. J9 TaxID=935844 RepID=UPI00119F283D|nr:ArsR family transcriptional regulator [Nocardioides sp. J9]TWG91764.1 helix-turn-helix protein [Nocardioides sp. J9]